MKTLYFILLLVITTLESPAQEERYREAMLNTLTMVGNASCRKDYLEAAARFERIASAEKSLWMPFYYGAFTLIVMSYDEEDMKERDRVLDRAQAMVDSAMVLCPGESEIHVLQAFLYPSRILVDPMDRGMLYLEKMSGSLETAKALNPDNPRAFFLEGINKLNLPPAFGGGPEVARPILEKAAASYSSFRTEDPLWPAWGEDSTMEELKKLD